MNAKKFLVGTLVPLFFVCSFVACNEESVVVHEFNLISSKDYSLDGFSCTVDYYEDKAIQTIIFNDSVNAASGLVVNYDGTVTSFVDEQFYQITDAEMEAVCRQLEQSNAIYDKSSYQCGNGEVHFKVTLDKDNASSVSYVKSEMEQECADLKKSLEKQRREMNSVFAFDDSLLLSRNMSKDENTLYFEDFASKASTAGLSGTLGYAFSLDYGDSTNLGWNLTENIEQGSLEFFFRPYEGFTDGSKMLVGNDGSRLLVYGSNGNLVFMMNRPNEFGFVKAKADLVDGWNFIRAEWDGTNIYLYLNGDLIGEKNIGHGYVASSRSGENIVVIGYKSSCCMSGAGQQDAMYTAADFGPIRISNIMRSKQ